MLEEEIIVIEPDDEEEIVVLEEAIEKVYPQLENLEVNPSGEKQVFNHEGSYGYDEVVVNAITGDTLEIVPSKEEQTFNGVYTEVKSKGVTSEVDENIKPNNIKSGVNILGVEGTLEAIDYWSTELSSVTTNQFNLINYLKELPRYINISNWTSTLGFGSKSLEKADLRLWDLSNITNISFSGASKLKELNMNGCKIDKITSLSQLCAYCSSLEEVDLKGIDTSKITDMSNMFTWNTNLKTLDLSTFDTSNVTNMVFIFFQCTSLKRLDIRSFTFDKVTNYGAMFDSVPADCLIIVKGETEKAWVLTQNNKLTNIKTVAELGE